MDTVTEADEDPFCNHEWEEDPREKEKKNRTSPYDHRRMRMRNQGGYLLPLSSKAHNSASPSRKIRLYSVCPVNAEEDTTERYESIRY
jgi:hypothetical protein